MLLFPTVVYAYEFNQLKISRGFKEHKWVWFWKRYFSVRVKVLVVFLWSLITLAAYIPVDVTLQPYLLEDILCTRPSTFFVAFGSVIILLVLCYFSYKVFFVVDPFFLKYEVLATSFGFAPLIIFVTVFIFYPTAFLPFFDSRISTLVAMVQGFVINLLFPTLLTFDSFERRVLRIYGKTSNEDQEQKLSEMKLKRTSLEQSKDEFHFVLQSPTLFDSFVHYSVKSWSVENILFYQAVEKFEEEFNNPDFDTKEEVQKIVDEFIIQGAPLEVNIENSQRQEIFNVIKSGNITIEIFLTAKHEIYRLMKGDTFEKWKFTGGYITALENEIEKGLPSSTEKSGLLDDFLNGSGKQKLPKTVHPISILTHSFSSV
mgnify:CR=1 FL=1